MQNMGGYGDLSRHLNNAGIRFRDERGFMGNDPFTWWKE
jgi:hypothetical protein